MGSVAVAIGAIPSSWISPKIAIYIGLTLIALGSGGIKTSVAGELKIRIVYLKSSSTKNAYSYVDFFSCRSLRWRSI